MPLVIADRVRETSTTTGTGTLTLDGAVTGFRTFGSAIGSGNTCYYTITLGADYEIGLGTVGTGTLARTTVLKSSNSNNAVNFGAGTKDVFVTYAADVAVTTNGATFTGDVTLNAQSDLRFADSDSSNWVSFQAPATIASNITWTLPSVDGTNGQVLQTNGTGTLSWVTSSGISTGKAIAMAIVFGG